MNNEYGNEEYPTFIIMRSKNVNLHVIPQPCTIYYLIIFIVQCDIFMD